MSSNLRFNRAFSLILVMVLAGTAAAPWGLSQSGSSSGSSIVTSVVVDSNPAIFAVLAALDAAGYTATPVATPASTPAGAAAATAATALRQQIQARLAASTPQVLPALKAFYQNHRVANPNQDLAQYVTLALFLESPPQLSLSVPVAGLPPQAAAVAGFVPLAQQFYTEADVASIWNSVQPAYEKALAQDSALVRNTFSAVDTFFRLSGANLPRQFFVFPDALIAPGQADALNYQENYYFVASLDLQTEVRDLRHTYLHFVLDPLVSEYSAQVDQVGRQILPLVLRAPGLGMEFKSDANLFYVENLVRAVEIQLDPGTAAQKQQAVEVAMKRGLVMTQYWYNQLTAFRSDPADFAEFYPSAAFNERLDELASQIGHIKFSAAPAPDSDVVQPVEVASLLERANQSFEKHDLSAAAALAQAELKNPDGDPGDAWFLLAKIAAERNQPQAAVSGFQKALSLAPASNTHVHTWANLYLARLYDAENQRAQAISHYRAALVSADTDTTKKLAEQGIKQPFRPPQPSASASH